MIRFLKDQNFINSVQNYTIEANGHEKTYKIGGTKVLLELLNQIPNLVYLEEYIQLIQDKFLRRSLINLGYQAINSAYITNIPLEKILNDFEKKSFKLTTELNGIVLDISATCKVSELICSSQYPLDPCLK